MAGQEVCNRSLDLLAELLNRRENLGAGAAGGWERGTTCQCQSWGQTELRAAVFCGSLWKSLGDFLSWSESSMGASCSYLKWNCLPIPWTSLITAIFNTLQWFEHHTQLFHKGTYQAFPDWQPCKPTISWRSNGALPPLKTVTTGEAGVWWNIRVTPVLPAHLQWEPQCLLGPGVKAAGITALTQSCVACGLNRQMHSREWIWIHFQRESGCGTHPLDLCHIPRAQSEWGPGMDLYVGDSWEDKASQSQRVFLSSQKAELSNLLQYVPGMK